jgi:hypothetical protein
MEDDRDLRNAILLLVRICKLFQVRSLSLNTALSAIVDLPPAKRAKLTHAQILEEVQKAETHAKQVADELSGRIEEALAGSDPFLQYLRIYAFKVSR